MRVPYISSEVLQRALCRCWLEVALSSARCHHLAWLLGRACRRLRDVMCVALLELEDAQLEKGLLVLLVE